MQIIVAGQVVDYGDEGDGPVLLMVHGWRDQKSTWRPLIKILKANFRCVAIDLPNFGVSAENESVIDLPTYATALKEFLTKLDITAYTYIGHSMGGQLGIYATAHEILHPQRLILIASAGIRSDNAVRRRMLQRGTAVFRKFIPAATKKKLYHAIGSDYDPSLSPIHKIIIEAMLSTDVQQEAAKITVPTLLVYGSKDDATPAEYGERLHHLISGSQFALLKDDDHFVHQKASDQVAQTICTFLGKGA
jgi:pimeloyl-ACP methyl ester carboxylesterase